MISFLKALMFLAVLAGCSATDAPKRNIEGKLQFPAGVVAPKVFNITTKITLNGGEYMTYSRQDGSFVIFDVGPGIHQLDFDSKVYHFPQVKIQLLEESMDAPKCLEYAYPGATKKAVAYPLVVTPKGTNQYFEVKKGFSIFGLLRNPMVLLMLLSVGMMVLMPKMMEGLDPEEKARMREQMKNQQDPSAMLSQMFGDFSGATEEPPSRGRKERKRVKQN